MNMSRLLLIRWPCLSQKWRLHQPEFRNEGKVVVNFCRITFRCGVSRTAIRSSGLNIFREISIFLPLSVDCRKKRGEIRLATHQIVADGKINRWTSTVSFLLRMKMADGGIPAINCAALLTQIAATASRNLWMTATPPKERATKGRGPRSFFIQSQWPDSNGCKVTAGSIVDPGISNWKIMIL